MEEEIPYQGDFGTSLLIVLAIPVLALAVVELVKLYYLLALQTICAQAGARGADLICYSSDIATAGEYMALGTGLLGLCFVGFIALAGYVSQENRQRLFVLFRFGLYITIYASILLCILYTLLLSIFFLLCFIFLGSISPSLASDNSDNPLLGLIVIFGVAVLAGIVFGAIAGIMVLANAPLRIPQIARCTVLGRRLRAEESPHLWQCVHELAARLGSVRPHHLVVGLEPTFFVTEAQVHCLDGMLTGRTLYLSLPLCRLLTMEEFQALIGHELGHFQGWDTRFSQRFYPLYRGSFNAWTTLASQIPDPAEMMPQILDAIDESIDHTSDRIMAMLRNRHFWWRIATAVLISTVGLLSPSVLALVLAPVLGLLALVPAPVVVMIIVLVCARPIGKRFAVFKRVLTSVFKLATGVVAYPVLSGLSFFFQTLATVERHISRERELEADQAALHVVAASSLATALVKLHAWPVVWDQGLATDDLTCPNLSAAFAETVQAQASPTVQCGGVTQALDAALDAFTHPTDTHPPLALRLQALGLSLEAVAPLVLPVVPATPAIGLIDNYTALEASCTVAWHQRRQAERTNRLWQYQARRLQLTAPSWQQVFLDRMALATRLHPLAPTNAALQQLHMILLEQLWATVRAVDPTAARGQGYHRYVAYVAPFTQRERWQHLSASDQEALAFYLTPFPDPEPGEAWGRGVDGLILQLQLAHLHGAPDRARSQAHLWTLATALVAQLEEYLPLLRSLQREAYWPTVTSPDRARSQAHLRALATALVAQLEAHRALPAVQEYLPLLRSLQREAYWPTVTLPQLEQVRTRLRSCILLAADLASGQASCSGSEFEHGVRTEMTVNTVLKIVRALGVGIDYRAGTLDEEAEAAPAQAAPAAGHHLPAEPLGGSGRSRAKTYDNDTARKLTCVLRCRVSRRRLLLLSPATRHRPPSAPPSATL